MRDNIPEKLDNIIKVKDNMSDKLKSTKLNPNDTPFRQYADLIRQIPDTGALTTSEVDACTKQLIEINGEKA